MLRLKRQNSLRAPQRGTRADQAHGATHTKPCFLGNELVPDFNGLGLTKCTLRPSDLVTSLDPASGGCPACSIILSCIDNAMHDNIVCGCGANDLSSYAAQAACSRHLCSRFDFQTALPDKSSTTGSRFVRLVCGGDAP